MLRTQHQWTIVVVRFGGSAPRSAGSGARRKPGYQGKGWPSRVRVPVGPPLGIVIAQMTLAAA